MLEMEGIYAPSYDISFLKISIYHHPEEFGRKIRLIFNIKLIFPPKKDDLPKEIRIFLNTKTGTEITDIRDLSHKIEKKYSEEIGACWDPEELKCLEITNIRKEANDQETKEEIREKFSHYFSKESGKIALNLKFKEKENKGKKKNKKGENKKESNPQGLVLFALDSEDFLKDDSVESGRIILNLKLEKEWSKKEKENKEESREEGMIFFALYLEGNFLEEDPWWKKLLGISSFAWEFPYVFWSHNEKSLIPDESIKECKEAQIFIVIPKKMIKSISRISCVPGSDHLHEMKDNDRAIYCEFEDDEESVENIKKWVKPGSFSLSWDFSNTLKISKKIVLGHLDAYPRSTNTLIFFFVIFSCLAYRFFSDKFDEILLQFLFIFAVFYLLFTGINYSFHSIRQSYIRRGVYQLLSITLTCILLTLGFRGINLWGLLATNISISDASPLFVVVMLSVTLLIFACFSYRKQEIVSGKLTAIIIIFIHIGAIFLISYFFAYLFESGNASSEPEKYWSIAKYWAQNNIYGTLGFGGLEKLIK